MPVSEPRHTLAEVTPASLDGWQQFTKKHGGDPTVLAEVIGLYLATYVDRRLPAWLERLVRDAVELQHQRKRRPRGNP